MKPRPQASTSIPGLINLLQSEWDSLMLEIHTLKEHLNTTRQELSQALYQHEGACRVICRLIKERDSARKELAELKEIAAKTPLKEDAVMNNVTGVTPDMIEDFNELSESLSQARKGKKIPEDVASEKDIAGYKEDDSIPLAKSDNKKNQGILCIDIWSKNNDYILTGAKDGNANLFNVDTKQILTSFNHEKKITMTSFIPINKLLTITCSADATAK